MNDAISRINRLLWWRRLITFTALDIAAVLLIVIIFDDGGETDYDQAFFTIAALWVVQIAFSLRSFLWGLASTALSEPRLIEASFLETMRAGKMPSPLPKYAVQFDSLSYIVDDQSYSAEQRVAAGTFYTAIATVGKARGILAWSILSTIADKAYKAYVDEIRHLDDRRAREDDAEWDVE